MMPFVVLQVLVLIILQLLVILVGKELTRVGRAGST